MHWTGVWCNDIDRRTTEPAGHDELFGKRDAQMRRTDPENSNRSFFRAQDRVFTQNGQWFFTAREGDIGPFNSRETAIKEVTRYVQERSDLERFQRARERRIQRQPGGLSLSILPKGEESDITLDELILENQS